MEKKFWELYDQLTKVKPRPAEAAIWLQGDRYDRAKNVLKIYNKLTNLIVISGNNLLVGTKTRPGEKNTNLYQMKEYLLKNKVKENDIIIENQSFNSHDQAVNITNLAESLGWHRIILVASAYHQPRVLLNFLKQKKITGSPLEIDNYPIIMDMEAIPGGRKETVKNLCLSEIKKIKKYSNDLLPIEAGLKYLKR